MGNGRVRTECYGEGESALLLARHDTEQRAIMAEHAAGERALREARAPSLAFWFGARWRIAGLEALRQGRQVGADQDTIGLGQPAGRLTGPSAPKVLHNGWSE
jgi:hypothetical protein